MVGLAFALIPIFNNPEQSIINTVQRLYGMLSMPILSAFIVGLLFKNVDARAVIISVICGVAFYYWMLMPLAENASLATQNVRLHYIHLMAINLIAMVVLALSLNRTVFKQRAIWDAATVFGKS
jgi:SSS family solute:Na+ symporter